MKTRIIRKSIYASIAVVMLFGITACGGGGGGYYRSSGEFTIYSNEVGSMAANVLGEYTEQRDIL
ncbi:MAG: hypothetical protein V7752_19320 [Halopseudomonas sp.]